MDRVAIVTGVSRGIGQATAIRLVRDFDALTLVAVGKINAAVLALAKAFREPGILDEVQVNTVLPGSASTDRRRTMLQGYADMHSLPLVASIDQVASTEARQNPSDRETNGETDPNGDEQHRFVFRFARAKELRNTPLRIQQHCRGPSR